MRLIQSIDSQVRICNEILNALNYLTGFARTAISDDPRDWDDHIMFIEDERDRLVREKTQLENGTHEIWAVSNGR